MGVYLDQGTTRTLVRRCVFVGQAWAAIGDYLGQGNGYYENDFSGIRAGAVAVSHDHVPRREAAVSGSVVVTDAEERAVLGACRGLTSAGYRVCAVARLRPAATHWSRACSERVTLPGPADQRRALRRRARGAPAKRYATTSLIPGSDAALIVVSEHRERLEPWTTPRPPFARSRAP